jgi:glycosyltransferase involved in cell wall biosynthesis
MERLLDDTPLSTPEKFYVSCTSISIIIPCFNEAQTIEHAIKRVLSAESAKLTKQIIVVDDGSTDRSAELVEEILLKYPAVKLVRHPVNLGKGAAIRSGFNAATGDIVLIQDADLEYSPSDYPKLLAPILDGRADVVYGSRFRGGAEGSVLYFWHAIGNSFLTLLSNMFTNLTLSDMETGYKVFRKEVIEGISLQENRFGIEPEITAKISKLAARQRFYEVGISYSGRTYADGKKVNWKDGFRAIYCIFRYNLFP